MNEQTPKRTILVFVILAAAVLLGFYIYSDLFKKAPPPVSEGLAVGVSTPTVSAATATKPAGQKAEPKAKVEVSAPSFSAEYVDSQPQGPVGIPAPDLNRPVPAGTVLSSSEKENLEKLVGKLKENPNSFWDWLSLGLLRKSIGDYEGAGEAWEYSRALAPSNPTVLGNLGNLYAYYLKDYKKAEKYYNDAIEADPAYIYSYREAFNFYRDVVGDPDKARAVAEKGLQTMPYSVELKELLEANPKPL